MSEPLQFIIVIAFGRDTQQMARRNDQARCRPLQLADRQMGMETRRKILDIECPLAASRRRSLSK
jgi:hypothetical protein